jgi:predicted PilT family ATPase
MPGQAMIIESKDMTKKEDALREVLNQIERIEQDTLNNKAALIELMTFIPEGLVAVSIGRKGQLIQRIKEETGIKMVINQRVRNMEYRSTFAVGSPKSLARAVTIMFDTIEEQAYLVKDWEKIKN